MIHAQIPQSTTEVQYEFTGDGVTRLCFEVRIPGKNPNDIDYDPENDEHVNGVREHFISTASGAQTITRILPTVPWGYRWAPAIGSTPCRMSRAR